MRVTTRGRNYILRWDDKALYDATILSLKRALEIWGISAENTMRRLLSGPSPSADYSPPGMASKRLRNSIRHVVHMRGGGTRLIGRAGSLIKPRAGQGSSYGMYLEFGTRRHAPRPWLRPAWDASKPVFIAALRGHI